MSCHHFKSADGTVTGHICLANIFRFDGYTFEDHKLLGPLPVHKRTLEPRKTVPPGFWKMFDRWFNLTDNEKEKYRICG